MVLQARSHHLKGIHRIPVASGMNLGVQDVEAGLVKVAANTGKQIRLIGRIHHHLQAFAHGGHARAHHHADRSVLGFGLGQAA